MKNLSLLVIFVFILAAKNYAQANVSVSQAVDAARQRTMDEKMRAVEMDRIRMQANADRIRSSETNQRFPEIKEDFERLQIINTDFLQAASVKENLDLKVVFKAITEIKKRAVRLKSNLFPISSKTDSDKEIEQKDQNKLLKQEIKPLAIQIDNAIYRLVSNNIFQNIKLVDLKDSEKAENDLKNIIFLCDVVETKIKTTRKSS